MLDKIIELILSAKAGAVSGVIILAGGALVTATTGSGVTTVTIQHPSNSPIVEIIDTDPAEEEAGEPAKTPKPKAEKPKAETKPVVDNTDCNEEAHARNEARQKVQDAFSKYHGQLVDLKQSMGGRTTAKATDAIVQADGLLKEIRQQAVDVIQSMGTCDRDDQDDDDEDESEDEDENDDEDGDEKDKSDKSKDKEKAQASLSGDALSMAEVAENAVVAMETVFNLAKSTVLVELESLATPKPTKSPKATAKPTSKATKKPSCDDKVYEAKKRLSQSFEKYHGGHDKLIWETKKWADERTKQALNAADQVIHRTYDKAKEEILRAGCEAGEKSGMAIAERASVTLEQTYNGSQQLFQVASANKPATDLCTKQMYDAKAKLSQAFEQWHGLNDKLIWSMKSHVSDQTMNVLNTADQVLHRTYDETKQAILSAACTKTGSNALELASKAAGVFQSTHTAARQAVAAELATAPTPKPEKP